MRVRLPIGDPPFAVTGVRRGGEGLVVEASSARGSRRPRWDRTTCRSGPGPARAAVVAAGAVALDLARRR